MDTPAENLAAAIPGNREARSLLLIAAAAVLALCLAHAKLVPARTAVLGSVPLAALVLTVPLALSLAREGTATTPRVAAGLGIAFIVGGAVFDMTATVMHSPDLRFEGNPIARALLDSGHSLAFVYCYAMPGCGTPPERTKHPDSQDATALHGQVSL
jgi:hypothetical protein